VGRAEFHKALAGPEALHEVYVELEAWVHQGLPGLDLPHGVKVMLTEAFEEAIRQGEAGFVDDYLATVRPLGFDPSVVSAPTRLLIARDDTTVPPGHGHWWQAKLPDAHVSWFHGTHMDPAPDNAEIHLIEWAAHGERSGH
jgi:pimeloyl-ACP methyl ester carboxylesterase